MVANPLYEGRYFGFVCNPGWRRREKCAREPTAKITLLLTGRTERITLLLTGRTDDKVRGHAKRARASTFFGRAPGRTMNLTPAAAAR